MHQSEKWNVHAFSLALRSHHISITSAALEAGV
jgi:hypothetical protein